MNRKKMIKWTILAISMLQFGNLAVTPALAEISKAFPDYGVSAIQMIINLPGLAIILALLLGGRLSAKMSNKSLANVGLVLFVAAGLGAYLVNNSLQYLYLWAIILGCGMGLFIPTTVGMIADYFEGQERSALMGQQTAFVSIGSVIMTFIGGLLTTINWQSIYLIYLAGIPVLVMSMAGIPSKAKTDMEIQDKAKVSRLSYYYAFIVFLCVLIYNIIPANISMFLDEIGIQNAAAAGSANSVFLVGGIIAGLLFHRLSDKLNEFMFCLAFMVMSVGIIMSYATVNMGIIFIGVFIAGMGLSLLLPQAFFYISMYESPAARTMAISVIFIVANLGGFISPFLFSALAVIMGDLTISFRLLSAGTLAFVFALLLLIITLRKQNKPLLSDNIGEDL